MPNRAKSHGYSPEEMKNDEKCAEAAVRELYSKLEMARGNLNLAKNCIAGKDPRQKFTAEKSSLSGKKCMPR